ncbi:MAG TPA: hypothetical protein VJ853_00420 [Thermoanaerobaculia bacterium]|nr:hypothetical protein [Thermoanaerobaculia bacterium]
MKKVTTCGIVFLFAVCAVAADINDTFKALKFREIGPAVMGGRIDDFAVVESNPDIVYVGSASGGVFKTVNGGITWEPLFDDQATSTIGDITIAPSDPSIVWVGSGEANNRQSSSWGNGVYKSTDGGKTWTRMGLEKTMAIGRIVINPSDPNIVYVAAGGNLWGPSPDRGVYKTTDGGKTWTKVLFVNDDTGVSDIIMDPTSPGTLLAAAYQRRRTVFGYNGSGPGSAIYKTTDGGATWKKVEKGLPWDPDAKLGPAGDDETATDKSIERQQTGRIGLDFYRKNPNVVYAVVENAEGGVFRSEDRGETWTKMSSTDPRGSYYSQIRVDPNNDQRIWVCGAQMYVSDDGGRTFRTNVVTRIHGDFHALWIDPNDSNLMLAGSDGGIHISRDRGLHWDFVNTIPLGQFYEIGLDMQKPYHLCGGLQDNNVWCGPSMTFDNRGISNGDWFTVGGGDGFYAQIDPNDPNIVYTESQDGNVLRRNLKTHESRSIRPVPPENERYRFQWNSPIVISKYDSNTIYYGGNYLFKSTNRGDDWVRLGPDLTNNEDRYKIPIMGRVVDKYTMSGNDGVENWPCSTTVSESPVNKDVLWVGTDDGNLQVTRDGGKTWTNVYDKIKGLPKGLYVSRIVASKNAEGTAYATIDGHRSSDFNVYVFVTKDFGQTWTAIRNGISDDAGTVHVIREDPRNANMLWLGTERALFVSYDLGAHWTKVKLNLPVVPVDDIAIHPRDNDLVLATHGRSIWIFDDLTPFQEWSDAITNEDLHLFDIRPATEYRIFNRGGNTGHEIFLGPNPPLGAVIDYYLKTKPGEKERVKITVTDKSGKVVRELDGTKDVGLNRVVWDMRTRSLVAPPREEGAGAEPTETEFGERNQEPAGIFGQAAAAAQARAAAAGGGGGGGFGGGTGQMRVEPGDYIVKVSVGSIEQSKPVTVEEDPRITLTAEDRTARRQALDQLAHMGAQAVAQRRAMMAMRRSLNEAVEGWKRPAAAKPPETIQKQAEDLLKRTEETCKKFGTPAQCGERGPAMGNAGPALVYTPPPVTTRILQLIGGIEGFAAPPTATQLDQIKILQAMLQTDAAESRKLVQEDLPALNKAMAAAGVPYIAVPRGGREGATQGD